jgi:hypothetical protein
VPELNPLEWNINGRHFVSPCARFPGRRGPQHIHPQPSFNNDDATRKPLWREDCRRPALIATINDYWLSVLLGATPQLGIPFFG